MAVPLYCGDDGFRKTRAEAYSAIDRRLETPFIISLGGVGRGWFTNCGQDRQFVHRTSSLELLGEQPRDLQRQHFHGLDMAIFVSHSEDKFLDARVLTRATRLVLSRFEFVFQPMYN